MAKSKPPYSKPFKRVKTPMILQMEAAECGAASLGIVLAFHGCYQSLEALRIICGVSRDGCNAWNMLKAARHYGFKAYGAQLENLDELAYVKPPCVLFWKFNHFVVFEGVKQGKFYINDPAAGHRIVGRNEFSESFTGVMLLVERTPQSQQIKPSNTVWHNLRKRVLGYIPALSFILITTLSLVIPGILVPGFTKIFIDDLLIRGMSNWLMPLLLGMGATACMRGLLTWLQQRYLLRLQLHLLLQSSARFFWHILNLPMRFFQQRFAGDLDERISANDRIAGLVTGGLTSNVVNLISIVFYGAVIFLIDWQLALIAVFISVINFSLLWGVSKKIANFSRTFLQERGRLAGLLGNVLQMIEMIKATASENHFFQKLSSGHAKMINLKQSMLLYNQFLLIVPSFLNALLTIVILGIGSYKVMQGVMTIGTLVALQSLIASFSAPVIGLLSFGHQIQTIRGDLARLDDIFDYPLKPFTVARQPLGDEQPESTKRLTADASSEASDLVEKAPGVPSGSEHRKAAVAADAVRLPAIQDTSPPLVEMRAVDFAYAPLDEPLIRQFSLSIQAGECVALVGKTGSGKSTIAKLLMGLYPPSAGDILFEGQSTQASAEVDSMGSLSKKIAWVDQDIFLFEGTLHENVTLWDHSIAEERIVWALKQVYLYERVMQWGGLSYRVEEGGSNLSGGQRQCLELARAILNQPQLLILDEATASVDAILEQKIYAHLKKIGCALFIIAHRLSAIRDSDQIIVLDRANICEVGTHERLMERQGLYSELVMAASI